MQAILSPIIIRDGVEFEYHEPTIINMESLDKLRLEVSEYSTSIIRENLSALAIRIEVTIFEREDDFPELGAVTWQRQ
jgi:hypothetical protein